MSIILLVTDSVENNSNYSQLYTININLNFEYVKIVGFNFNSHVFLVMYQEIRFLNQMNVFKSRRETRVFYQFCFRERLKSSSQVGMHNGI